MCYIGGDRIRVSEDPCPIAILTVRMWDPVVSVFVAPANLDNAGFSAAAGNIPHRKHMRAAIASRDTPI